MLHLWSSAVLCNFGLCHGALWLQGANCSKVVLVRTVLVTHLYREAVHGRCLPCLLVSVVSIGVYLLSLVAWFFLKLHLCKT